MSETWPITDVTDWRVAGVETQGFNPHDWLKHDDEPRTWLFKPAREGRDRSIGEDVVEKLACELAQTFGVPAATVRLAQRGGVRGALVEDARPSGWDIQAGQALLPEAVRDYNPKDRQQRGHSVQVVRAVLERFGAPPGADLPGWFRAFDTFAGYLIFDALVAHTDRHARNWAVLLPPPDSGACEALCPSFDHASSLGHNVSQEARDQHLREGTVLDWARKGVTTRFERGAGGRRQSLVELAASAACLCASGTRSHWRLRVVSVGRDEVEAMVRAAPGVTDLTVAFIVEVVMANRSRLLDVLP